MAVEELVRERIELPAFSALDRLAGRERDNVRDGVDLGFLSLRWQAFVESRERGEVVLGRRELEVAVLSHVADALRSGDLFVPGSEAFADYREQLLPWDECEDRLPAY